MSLSVLILIILVLILNYPKIRLFNIKNIKIEELSLPFYILLTGVLSIAGLCTHINDNLILAFGFIYTVLSRSKVSSLSDYILNSVLLIFILGIIFFIENSLWTSIALISLVILNFKNKSMTYSLLALCLLALPFNLTLKTVYIQWGGILLIPIFIAMISAIENYDKLILSFLYIAIISNTKYQSLGYANIIALGIGMILLIGKVKYPNKSYINAMAFIPFVSISNPFNLIALYILFESMIYLKQECLKITKKLEIENGSIKSITYEEIVIVLLGLYLIFGGPGTPLAWILSEFKNYTIFLILYLLIDILIINNYCLEIVNNTNVLKVTIKKVEYVVILITLVVLMIVMKSNVFNYSPYSALLGTIFLAMNILFKIKPSWIEQILSFKRLVQVPLSLHVINRSKLNKIKYKYQKLDLETTRYDGLSETLVWSVFIMLVSILLIGRYL